VHIEAWLEHVPAVGVYLIVGVVVLVESIGIPLPGEAVLVGSALLATQSAGIDPLPIATCAAVGAIIGDSIGYSLGRRYGRGLLDRLGRRFPKHFSAQRVAAAEHAVERWGMRAVFFGRFIAWLRMFAGPLAGVLRMPYPRFLVANVLGALVWAGSTVYAVYYAGKAAEAWLHGFSVIGLCVLAVAAAVGFVVVRRRRGRAAATGSGAGSGASGQPDEPQSPATAGEHADA
jgi:membrane protein DedA with SNARE-associated domain